MGQSLVGYQCLLLHKQYSNTAYVHNKNKTLWWHFLIPFIALICVYKIYMSTVLLCSITYDTVLNINGRKYVNSIFKYTIEYLKQWIRVITKLPNSEQSYKGKVNTHNYINRQNQSTTGKLWNPQWLGTGISKEMVGWIRF
jgi:hypothetical protein